MRGERLLDEKDGTRPSQMGLTMALVKQQENARLLLEVRLLAFKQTMATIRSLTSFSKRHNDTFEVSGDEWLDSNMAGK